MTARRLNITAKERIARIAIGVLLITAALLLISGGLGMATGVAAILLVGAGLDLVITGVRGYCPLYARLGYIPRPLRRVHS